MVMFRVHILALITVLVTITSLSEQAIVGFFETYPSLKKTRLCVENISATFDACKGMKASMKPENGFYETMNINILQDGMCVIIMNKDKSNPRPRCWLYGFFGPKDCEATDPVVFDFFNKHHSMEGVPQAIVYWGVNNDPRGGHNIIYEEMPWPNKTK